MLIDQISFSNSKLLLMHNLETGFKSIGGFMEIQTIKSSVFQKNKNLLEEICKRQKISSVFSING